MKKKNQEKQNQWFKALAEMRLKNVMIQEVLFQKKVLNCAEHMVVKS